MTTRPPAPLRPCPKCGVGPGAYCFKLGGEGAGIEPLKGYGSHAERHPARAAEQASLAGLVAAYEGVWHVACSLCEAGLYRPCRRVIRLNGTTHYDRYEAGTAPVLNKPHLTRRLAATPEPHPPSVLAR